MRLDQLFGIATALVCSFCRAQGDKTIHDHLASLKALSGAEYVEARVKITSSSQFKAELKSVFMANEKPDWLASICYYRIILPSLASDFDRATSGNEAVTNNGNLYTDYLEASEDAIPIMDITAYASKELNLATVYHAYIALILESHVFNPNRLSKYNRLLSGLAACSQLPVDDQRKNLFTKRQIPPSVRSSVDIRSDLIRGWCSSIFLEVDAPIARMLMAQCLLEQQHVAFLKEQSKKSSMIGPLSALLASCQYNKVFDPVWFAGWLKKADNEQLKILILMFSGNNKIYPNRSLYSSQFCTAIGVPWEVAALVLQLEKVENARLKGMYLQSAEASFEAFHSYVSTINRGDLAIDERSDMLNFARLELRGAICWPPESAEALTEELKRSENQDLKKVISKAISLSSLNKSVYPSAESLKRAFSLAALRDDH